MASKQEYRKAGIEKMRQAQEVLETVQEGDGMREMERVCRKAADLLSCAGLDFWYGERERE